MRLSIKGEITAEHLAEAFATALKKLESIAPGSKFYGANLYLTPYDADGQAFDIGDDRGNSLIMNIPAPPGTIVKPALSAEAEQRRQVARDEERQREAEDAELHRKHRSELDRRHEILAAKNAEAQASYDTLNLLTSQLLTVEPERFIDGLNEAIRSTWSSLEPKEPHGPKKGEPKPVPVFSILDGKLLLSTTAWRQPKLVLNPVGTLKQALIAPVWTYGAWLVATAGFLKVMERLNGSLPEEILRDHLPGVKPAE
ncbi:OfxX fusion product (plasmid) [Pseudomonas silesiensis]|uniref:OfxX fusion product n=1 Tax=Pseudomonas silesiensis TaxID=1853130 RepID=UPI0030CC616A